MLTATWTPLRGVDVLFSDLPDVWLIALDRLARDLHVRQYGARIEHIDWMAMYDADGGAVWLGSSVTVAGHGPRGGNGSGMGASVDADVETVLVSMADLVQTEVAEVRTAWPWGEAGGFMSPQLIDGIAMWVGRDDQLARIGDLAVKN